MIGNDIIDLDLAQKESNWKRKGFLDKIFTKKEQKLIFSAENPTVMVWSLWSMKEAGYKIYNRQTLIRGYFPMQLKCFDLEFINGIYFGKVVIKDEIYFTKTEITTKFINTIAIENVYDFNEIKILENRKDIKKNNGIPSYFEKENSKPRPASISHHGKFEQIIAV